MVDYLCPQIYWGYGYQLSSGSDRFAYENILPEWLAIPRGSAALYIGLGAWRIGDGDGGADGNSAVRWSTGHAWPTRWPTCGPRGPVATPSTGTVPCLKTPPGPSWRRRNVPPSPLQMRPNPG